MLFNIANNLNNRNIFVDTSIVVTVIALAVTVLFCTKTLIPVIKDSEADPATVNRLFFASISSNFSGKRKEYQEAVKLLISEPEELVKDLADQIHANSKIAMVKAKYAKKAIISCITSGVFVAVVAAIASTINQ